MLWLVLQSPLYSISGFGVTTMKWTLTLLALACAACTQSPDGRAPAGKPAAASAPAASVPIGVGSRPGVEAIVVANEAVEDGRMVFRSSDGKCLYFGQLHSTEVEREGLLSKVGAAVTPGTKPMARSWRTDVYSVSCGRRPSPANADPVTLEVRGGVYLRPGDYVLLYPNK